MREIEHTETFGARAAEPGNCLDFLRFAFAVAVIFSHSFPLLLGSGNREPLMRISHQMELGGVAVAAFFTLSGFLVLQSWERSRGLGDYLAKRALRIYPGFVAACVLSAILFGALGADDLHLYFHRLHPGRFLVQTFLLQEPQLRSAFTHNPIPNLVNGPLWTIKWEFCCYLLVPLLAGVALRRRRVAFTVLFVAVVSALAAFDYGNLISVAQSFRIFGGPAFGWLRCVAYFMAGMNFYLWRDRIPIGAIWCAGAVALLLAGAHWLDIALVISGPYLLFYAGFLRNGLLRRWARFGDFSYGLYLYAWPIQQLLILWFAPRLTPVTLFLAAAVGTVIMAALSWFGIERPFLALKRNLTSSRFRHSKAETAV